MRIQHFLSVFIFAALALAAVSKADTVILKSGARVQGNVTVSGRMVRISNENGTHRIQRSRVARVVRHPAPGRSHSRSRDSRPGIRSARRAAHRAISRDVARALSQRVSVSFDDTPLSAAIEYLREVTGANFSFSDSTLATREPLTLHLRDVSVHNVLDLIVESRDLNWGVKDDIIRIREGAVRTARVRVYDVRDLLLNIEDKEANRTLTLSEGGHDDDDEEDGDYGQWGGEDDGGGWGFESGDSDDERGAGPTPSQSLRNRARDLGRLITSTVRPSSWDEPALLVIGGVNQDESEEALGEGW